METPLKTIKELKTLIKDSSSSSPLKDSIIMISGTASNIVISFDPQIDQGGENGNNERDIYLFFEIADSTDPTVKTQIACCEKDQPNHRFWRFEEKQDLEVLIAADTIKIAGEPNVYGALTVREKKSYNQNPRYSGEASEMIKNGRRNPSQWITTPGEISTDHSDKKQFFTSISSSKRYFESDKKDEQKPINKSHEVCKNLHLEYFISENDIDINNKAINRQENILRSPSNLRICAHSQRTNIDREWNFSSFEESEEIDGQLSGTDEDDPMKYTKNTGYNFEMLKAKILSMSESEEWDSAKMEWKLRKIYKIRYGRCPCDHYPITDHCVIKNQENGNEMFLGNCCIRHISEAQHKRAQKIWQIFRDPKVRANQDLIDHAFSQGYITEGEKNTYETLPKRKRTDIQNKIILELNLKIIRNWDAKETKCEKNSLHRIEIYYESSDQALYYKCTECDYKIKFHEDKEKNLEDCNADFASEAEVENISRHGLIFEDKMEEEFEGYKKVQDKKKTKSCINKMKIKELFDDDILSPESSSEEEDASQDENFVPSQSRDEEEESLDGDTSENEDSLTSESIEKEEDGLSYNPSEDENYTPVENNTLEEDDLNQTFKITNSLCNGEQHSNQ